MVLAGVLVFGRCWREAPVTIPACIVMALIPNRVAVPLTNLLVGFH